MVRRGDDIALIAIGTHVSTALQAADILGKDSITARVINARFVKPLDEPLIVEAAKECKAVITIEENSLMGGFGSAVLECLADNNALPARFSRLGLPDHFIEHGSQAILREKLGLTAKNLAEKAKHVLYG